MRYLLAIFLALSVSFSAGAEANRMGTPGVDYFLQVARGKVLGHSILRGKGERETIQVTAQGEDVWRGNQLSAVPQAPLSHTFIPRPADVGEQMTIVSESTADNGATATGALTLTVTYLDAVGDERMEVVTLNGTTQVDTLATDIRFVQDLQVLTVGSNTVAEGHIRIFRATDERYVYSMIEAGSNQSLVPHKMVPRGKTLYLQRWVATEASTQKRIFVRLRADCNNVSPPVRQAGVFLIKSTMGLNSSGAPFSMAYAVPEFSVVKASAWALSINAEVAVHWWGVLIDNE